MTIERVFVGGFDPPRLTADEVLDRMRANLPDLVIEKLDKASRYCHLNVRSTDEQSSALEAIQRLYNNVRWKGCRLRVEAAQPHFLERLEQERQQRQQQNNLGNSFTQEAAPLRRYLRIRQRHGREASKVDTKPVTVDDFTSFSKMRKRRRFERSIRLQFTDDTVEQDGSSVAVSSDEDDAASTATSEKGAYVWSDEESSSSSSPSSAASEARRGSCESTHAEDLPVMASAAEAYSSESAEEEEDDDDALESAKYHDNEEPFPTDDAVDRDMDTDVQSNLNVLAQLFPDMVDRKPQKPKEEQEALATSGWGATGEMIRFDPSQKSSEQFVVPHKEPDNEPVAEEPTDTNEQDQGDVYKQTELEEVFRKAREVDATPLLVKPSDKEVTPEGFAFSFDLGRKEGDPPTTGGFSFGFDVNPDAKPKSVPAAETLRGDSGDGDELAAEHPEQRRPRCYFAEEELDALVEDFYSLNDGQRILEGLDGFRNDEKLAEQWKKDRRVLTLDWKRKRKYALSRRHKKGA